MSIVLSPKTKSIISPSSTACFHCGDECNDTTIAIEGKKFCCEGCKMVYEIINTNDLSQYYRLQKQPGTANKQRGKKQYDWLEDATIVRQLINFKNDDFWLF